MSCIFAIQLSFHTAPFDDHVQGGVTFRKRNANVVVFEIVQLGENFTVKCKMCSQAIFKQQYLLVVLFFFLNQTF